MSVPVPVRTNCTICAFLERLDIEKPRTSPTCHDEWHFLGWFAEETGKKLQKASRLLARPPAVRVGEQTNALLDGEICVDVWIHTSTGGDITEVWNAIRTTQGE